MMLLLEDIDGLGSKFDIVDVPKERRIEVLAKRVALNATPLVRKRYAGMFREVDSASGS